MCKENKHPLQPSEIAELDAEMLFDCTTLQFLLTRLTEDDRGVLKDIASVDDDPIGYRKTNAPDFNKNRRKYEITWAKLEAQGLMTVQSIGNMRICRLTVRGKQAMDFLNANSN
jgi:hypothetical protein